MVQFLAPETDVKFQFLAPETDRIIQFLVSRNRQNGSGKFVEPETDKMIQFLGQETVFSGRVKLYQFLIKESFLPKKDPHQANLFASIDTMSIILYFTYFYG